MSKAKEPSINCPICNTALKNITCETQSIDVCMECGGMWFDEDELREVIDTLISKNKIDYQIVKEAYKRKPRIYNREEHPIRKCPRCNKHMQTFNYCYDSNVFLDKCPFCKGIWADRGEILQVAKHIRGNPKVDKLANALAKVQQESMFLKHRAKELTELSNILSTRGFTPGFFGKFIALWYTLFPLPLTDNFPTRKFPKITVGLIAINILVFVFQSILISKNGASYIRFVGVIPSLGFSIARMYSFITTMFVHGGFIHILGNMYYLWLFGDNIEDEIGSLKFIIFYFLCGILGSIVLCLIHPSLNKPVIGASGAISGILAGYMILFPKADLKILWLGKVRTCHAIYYLLFWIILQLIPGAVILGAEDISIGYWAHIGGFISGLALIHLLKPKSILSHSPQSKGKV